MHTGSGAPEEVARRKFLRAVGVYALLSPRVLAPSAFGLLTLLWPKPASAEPVTVCIAVASVVFGAIQAHNASDGLSGMLKASLEYQRLISGQLSSVQQGIADVLLRLGTLEGAVSSLPEEVRLRGMHDDLSSAAHQYLKVTTRSGYADYQSWAKAKDVQDELEQIAIVLNRNFAIAEVNQWLGPTSTLYLTAAAHTLLAIKFAQKVPARAIRGYAEQMLQTYARIENPKITTSTAALSLRAQANFQKNAQELGTLGFAVKPAATEDPSPIRVVLGYVAIQDYTAPKLLSTRHRRVGRTGASDGVESSIGAIEEWSKERVGDTQYFRHVLTIDTHWTAGSPAIRQFQVAPQIQTEVVGAEVAGVHIERFVAGTPEIRRQLAVDDAHMAGAVVQKKKIEGHVSALNIAAASMTLCELTLVNLRISRQTILERFGGQL